MSYPERIVRSQPGRCQGALSSEGPPSQVLFDSSRQPMDAKAEGQVSNPTFTGSGRPPQSLGKVSKGQSTCAPQPVSTGHVPNLPLPLWPPHPPPCKTLVAVHKQAALCLTWPVLLSVRARSRLGAPQRRGKALSCPPRQIQWLELA